MDNSGNPLVYHTDGLGSVRALTDASGNVVQTYQYDEYGNVVASSGGITQPFQYTGEQQDAETGFLYLRARYYDQASGRFTGRDDYSGRIVTPQWLDQYTYVQDSPVTFSDPGGHCGPVTPLCVAAAVAVEEGVGATAIGTLTAGAYVYRQQIGQGLEQFGQATGDLIAAAKKKLKPGLYVGDENISEGRSPEKYQTETGTAQ